MKGESMRPLAWPRRAPQLGRPRAPCPEAPEAARRPCACGLASRRIQRSPSFMANTAIGKRAGVIGAGMARVPGAGPLVGRLDEVVVLERDSLPGEPQW